MGKTARQCNQTSAQKLTRSDTLPGRGMPRAEKAAAPAIAGAEHRLSKNQGELVRAAALSRFNRIRRRVRRIRGNFFGGELAPRRRNCFLAVSAPGNAQHFSGNCVGVAVAGELAPPSTSLFGNQKRRPSHRRGGARRMQFTLRPDAARACRGSPRAPPCRPPGPRA